MKIKHKGKIKFLILLFLIFSLAFASFRNINQKSILCDDCNLIIIGIDTLRSDRVGYYDYKRKLTPAIDKLAENSYIFKNTITQASWTLPSFMSLFTSTYPFQHKITNKFYIDDNGNMSISNLGVVSPDIKTFTEILKQSGYKTAGFTGDAGVGSEFGFGKGFDEYYDEDRFGGFDKSFSLAESWISENKDNKFFVFIHGYDCHGDFELDYKKRFYSKNSNSIYNGTEEENNFLRDKGIKEGYLNLNENDLIFLKNLYDDKILNMDLQLANFMEYLEKDKLMDKTILIIVSDHGEEFLEHGKIDHGSTLYDELLKVVFMIKLPSSNKKIIGKQVRLIDIMPTVLNLLNININDREKDQIQGVNLIPLMLGKNLHLDAFSETDYLWAVSKKSIRTPDGWKFIVDYSSWEKELYNLINDPNEKNNLIEHNKNKAKKLDDKLINHFSENNF